jgi:hypothetical protein
MATEAELQQIGDDSVKAARGVSFPTISLPEAVDIITKAATYGRQQTISAIAGYAGHATANSGPFRQKLAALKEWGLVSVAGNTVSITDIGMGIALPTSPDAALDLQMRAFEGCAIFWKLYSDSAKGVALKADTLGNIAVTTHGVAVKSKDKFIRSFADSVTAVGLGEKVSGGDIKFVGVQGGRTGKTTPLSTGVDSELTSNSTDELEQSITGTPPAPASTIPVVIRQVWGGVQAEVVFEIRSHNPLPSAAFMSISETVTSIESLWEALRQHGDGGESGPAAA